jgi:hypothetical protein
MQPLRLRLRLAAGVGEGLAGGDRAGRERGLKLRPGGGLLAVVGTRIPMDSYMEPTTQTENRR